MFVDQKVIIFLGWLYSPYLSTISRQFLSKIPVSCFAETDKIIPKFIWLFKVTRMSKTVSKRVTNLDYFIIWFQVVLALKNTYRSM